MPDALLVPRPPAPRSVISADGRRIATYDSGDPDAPVVVAVHGFASSAGANWYATGWVRELTRAGRRVVSLDQRGHGASDAPHDPEAFSMARLVGDVESVLDAYLLDEVDLVGYSLGARVGWHAALADGGRVRRAVLGGIPDGLPLTRFRVAEARAHLAGGAAIGDGLTRAYVEMAQRIRGNDLASLIALVEGLQHGLQPDPATPPQQPVLFATGALDGILDASRRLAAATPRGRFFEIPGRNHFNAPTSRAFRDRALAFLGEPDEPVVRVPPAPLTPEVAGLAAVLFASGEDPAAPLDRVLLQRRLHDSRARWTACLDAVRGTGSSDPGA